MAGEPLRPELKKRIILCSDGTWLASDMGHKSIPTNVAKLARAVAKNGPDGNGDIVKQIVFYQSGLGSGYLPFQKAITGAFGRGLDTNVCQMYDFISNNYERGDELFFFGFSRGAFTVRSVAGLVSDIGVLSAVHMSRFPEMWEAYRMNTGGKPFSDSEWYRKNKEPLNLTTDVEVKVVGVWDTVGALGIPEWRVVSWAKRFLPINKQYAFHNTNVSGNLEYAFQALAIDENRLAFPPTLWHKPAGNPTKVEQCWFPGTHDNIGGGQKRVEEEEIAHNTFAWMVDSLSGMLTFENDAIEHLVKDHDSALSVLKTTDGWGCGPLVDNFSGVRGFFSRWILGKRDRVSGDNTGDPIHQCIHPIARVRRDRIDYKPVSLQGYVPENGISWRWTNRGAPTAPSIPEYKMEEHKKMKVAYEKNGSVEYRDVESLSRRLCPSSIKSKYGL